MSNYIGYGAYFRIFSLGRLDFMMAMACDLRASRTRMIPSPRDAVLVTGALFENFSSKSVVSMSASVM